MHQRHDIHIVYSILMHPTAISRPIDLLTLIRRPIDPRTTHSRTTHSLPSTCIPVSGFASPTEG